MTDANAGGDDLSIDQAASAYLAAQQSREPKEPAGQPEATEDDPAAAGDDSLATTEAETGDETEETEAAGQAEEEAGEEQSDQGRFVASNGKVKLPDGTVSTVADLIQGNLRDRDYRQKTMELAETRKGSEAQSAALKAKETQFTEQSDFMVRLLTSILPKAPDPALMDTDPVGYMKATEAHKQWTAHLNSIQRAQQQAKQASQAESAKAESERADAEWGKLLEKVPALSDQKRMTALAADFKTHGAEYGFAPQEIQRIGLDHRQALVLRDAISWRKLQASKGAVDKKVEGRPPVSRGSKRLSPSESRARATGEAMGRLKKSGSVEDAAAAYLASRKG